MKEPDSSSFQVVDLPEGAASLVDAEARRFLAPFVGRELSCGEAAKKVGVTVETMSYRVRRFERLGLLEHTQDRPRKGRAVKLYRAAPGFRVPLRVLPFADLYEVFRGLDAPPRDLSLRSLARLAEEGGFGAFELALYRDEAERVRLELSVPGGDWGLDDLLKDDMPALLFNWVPLHLTTAEAKALQRELMMVIDRYKSEAGEPNALLGVMMTPLGDE